MMMMMIQVTSSNFVNGFFACEMEMNLFPV